MKNFILVIFFGIVILVAAVWFYSGKNSHAEKAKDELKGAASQTKQFVQDQLGASNLNLDDIKEELARTGQVVRRKAEQAGSAVADAATDARITTTIKAKLLRDQELKSLSISVSTTDGKVTLSGSAPSPENIRKAIQLAMDTDGVHEVTSTIQVKS